MNLMYGCSICEKTPIMTSVKAMRSGPNWWYLRDYHGLSGMVCPECYEMVSHDSYGKPKHPIEYRNILQKFKGGHHGLPK